MMSETMVAETCLVIAEVAGDAMLVSKLGANEAQRARERCLSRAERSVEAHRGRTLKSEDRRLIAWFPRCDAAAMAANEMRERVAQLPPVSGISLSVRIGVHAGPFEAEHLPGDEVMKMISNLVAVASPGQVLMSGEAAMHLSEAARTQLDSQTQLSVSATGYEQPVFELKNGPITLRNPPPAAPASAAQPAARTDGPPRSRMMLRFLGNSFVVSEVQPVLLAGREEGNDVVVTDRRASRHHARVEWRQGRYVLIDNSTNGTYLVDDTGVEVVLRRGECDMPARGRVGLGFSPTEAETDSIMFDIGQR